MLASLQEGRTHPLGQFSPSELKHEEREVPAQPQGDSAASQLDLLSDGKSWTAAASSRRQLMKIITLIMLIIQ